MATKTTTIHTCDTCGLQETTPDDWFIVSPLNKKPATPLYGGYLSSIMGMPPPAPAPAPQPRHFCSRKCLRAWAKPGKAATPKVA